MLPAISFMGVVLLTNTAAAESPQLGGPDLMCLARRQQAFEPVMMAYVSMA